MLDPEIRVQVLVIVKTRIQKEMTTLCSKRCDSLLRTSSVEVLTTFAWDRLMEKISTVAPTLYAILDACVDVKRRKRKVLEGCQRNKTHHRSNTAVLGLCTVMLLHHRNQHMNLVQRLLALILHSGHGAKQV